MIRALAGLALCALALPACSTVDEWVFGPEPEPDERGIATSLDEAGDYPPVATVPQRPQLSYTVEQEREVVDALVNDRKNARYTGDVIRYRTGLRATPPDPETAGRAVSGADVVGPEGQPAPTSPTTLADATETPRDAILAEEDAESDDGGLDDFVRDMVDETEADPGLGTETAVLDQRQRAATVPGQKGESAFQRLFVWLGEQIGVLDDPADSDPEAAQPPPAAVPEAEPGEDGESAFVPAPKPAGANPPDPAPAKPEVGRDQALGGQAVIPAA